MEVPLKEERLHAPGREERNRPIRARMETVHRAAQARQNPTALKNLFTPPASSWKMKLWLPLHPETTQNNKY